MSQPALQAFGIATRQLISSLWATLGGGRTATVSTLSDEAQDLRDIACRLDQTDPQFAQDLYAAADRHEWGANAG